MTLLRRYGVFALIVVGACVPLMTDNSYYVHSVMAKVCIYAILVAGLDLVVGYAGDVSVGHAGLFAVGAYTTAILVTRLAVPYPVAVVAAILLASVFGLILGVPALRLAGPYLAVATIAFGLIIQTFINEAVWLTNGSQGISGIGPLRLGPIDLDGNHFYYLVYALMVLCLYGVHRLVRSYWGRALEALRENTVAAECSGVSRYRMKLMAFVFSAALAGLAGALFVHVDKYVGPPTFSLQLSILFLIMLIFGGTRSIVGNVLGTFIVVVLPDLFNALIDYQLLIFGGLLLFTLYFLPGGLSSLVRSALDRLAPLRRDGDGGAAASGPIARPEAVARVTATATDPILRTDGLTIQFGGLKAVDGLSIEIARGTIHALIGPNGSGKSTTVNLLSGVYRPTRGGVLFLERPLPGTAHDISSAGIARTFQNVALFGDMTVTENVLVGLNHTFKGGLAGLLVASGKSRRTEAEARARARALLEFVGLSDLASARARNLPYGKQRLLEIARALAGDPALILLDEPAAGLTTTEIGAVDELIRKMKAGGVSILLIEHHMDLVMAVSDTVTVLDFGQKIASGAPQEIQQNPRVIAAYLGSSADEAAHA
jgi:branched-chain amino acid transport system permease protein